MSNDKPVFDQRGQHVNRQYNAARDINFGSINDPAEFINGLRKLLVQVNSATELGVIPQETAIDVEANLRKAIVQAEEKEPRKDKILEHLGEAKSLLDGLASAAGLVTALAQASELVRRFFG